MGKYNKKYTLDEVREIVRSKGYELISDEYVNARTKMILKDFEGYYYYIAIQHLVNNRHSPRKINISNPYTIQNIKLWCELNNKPFYLLSNKYDGRLEKLKWKCLKDGCGEVFELDWGHISQGQGCGVCHGKQVGIYHNLLIKNPKLCEEWDYKKNKKLPSEYTPNSHEYAYWKCKECGHEWEASISNRNKGRGCPKCNESKGEKQLDIILTKYNIPHDSQYTFDDLVGVKNGLLKFDVPIFWDEEKTKLRMLIEYDGVFHYEKQYKDDGFETLRIHDNLKNEYCKLHDLKLLRIPYWDFDNIENILQNELNINKINNSENAVVFINNNK